MPPRTRYERSTAAGVIVYRRGSGLCRFLLLLSRGTRRPLWEFPKGGVDAGESLLDTALRELQEETGLAGDDIRLLPGFERKETYRFTLQRPDGGCTVVRKAVTYFLAEAFRERVVLSQAETSAYDWMDLETAKRRVRYAGRRRMLEDAARVAKCRPAPAAPLTPIPPT